MVSPVPPGPGWNNQRTEIPRPSSPAGTAAAECPDTQPQLNVPTHTHTHTLYVRVYLFHLSRPAAAHAKTQLWTRTEDDEGGQDVEGRKSKKINMLQETIMCLADQAARKVHSAPGTAGH